MIKPKINRDGTITVRIKATRQVIDMVPAAAYPMINGGTAEALFTESMTIEPAAERADAPAQSGPRRKPRRS